MRLFDVPAGQSVRITSKVIRWVENAAEHTVGENVTWTGVTTNQYFYYKGFRRRMIISHTVDWPEYAIWQRDVECEIL